MHCVGACLLTETRDKLKHNKETKDAEYKGHPTIQEALLFMIDKAPYNQPPKTVVSLCSVFPSLFQSLRLMIWGQSSPVKTRPPAPIAGPSRSLADPPSSMALPFDDLQELSKRCMYPIYYFPGYILTVP